MKKLLVSMMLILGMLAFAAESAPSATVGYVKYTIAQTAGADQNLIALPLDNGWASMTEIDPSGSNINVVNKWNVATQSWSGISYNSFMGSWFGTLAAEVGCVYQVNALTENPVIINGDLVAIPAYNLLTTAGADQNMIMHPLTLANMTSGIEIGTDIGSCNVVNQWNVATQSYSGVSYNEFMGSWFGTLATEIGKPLQVNMTADVAAWPGTKGQYVDGDNDVIMPKDPSKPIFYGVNDGASWYDFSVAPYDNITGAAWVTGREGDRVETDLGTMVHQQGGGGQSYFYFDMSAFASDWVTGDELNIHAYDTVQQLGGTAIVTTLDTGDLGPFFGGGLGDPAYPTPIAVVVDESGIDGNMPLETKLDQNYPNPFNPTTTINFSLKSEGIAKLNVYNYTGQLVNSLVDGQMSAGYHTVNFDASNLSAGVYYYTLEADNKTMTNKMVLVK